MITRGRPRDARIDEAILVGTRALLIEVGYSALSMESVAARAGVGKPTVYRRYPTKAALVLEAVFGRTKQLAIPDSGSLREDLIESYSWVIEEFAAPESTTAIAGLLADVSANIELAQYVRSTVIEPEYARVREMFERAQRRGEIRKGLDLELVIDVFTGTIFTRAALLDHHIDRDFGIRLIDLILSGLTPSAC